MAYARTPAIDRLLRLVKPTEDGCWVRKGAARKDRYWSIWVPDGICQRPGAHRVSYEHFVGPIPDGLQLDHLCRVRACVNPAHLEPVTAKENVRRSTSDAARNAIKTHCNAGHAFAPPNLTMRDGKRACLACRAEASRRYYAKKREAIRA